MLLKGSSDISVAVPTGAGRSQEEQYATGMVRFWLHLEYSSVS
jgi:hypothetical protein